MKLSILKAVICFTILFSSVNAYAQDYAIKTNGDTIHCEIRNFAFIGYAYLLPGDDQQIKLKPDEFKEFCQVKKHQSDNKTFVSVIKEGTTARVFMQYLERGKLNLLQNKESSFYGAAPAFGVGINNTFGLQIAADATGKGANNAYGLWVTQQSDTVKYIGAGTWLSTNKSKKRLREVLDGILQNNKAVYDLYDKDLAEEDYGLKTIQAIIHYYNTGERPIKKEVDESESQSLFPN